MQNSNEAISTTKIASNPESIEKPRRLRAVKLKILMYIAWRNLVSKKLRTLLTLTGIIIGIGAIFFLLSFGLGLQQLVAKEVVGDASIKAIDVSSPNSRIIKLDSQLVNKIKTYPHVTKVGTQYSFPGSITYNGADIDSIVYGVDKAYQDLTKLNLVEGRLLKDDDNKSLLINKAALKALSLNEQKKAINKTLSLNIPLQLSGAKAKEIKGNFTIVGVIDSGSGSELFLPSGLFDVAGVPNYKQVKVITDETKNVATLRKQIESNGLQTISPVDTLDQINQMFKFFNIVLVGFGAIGMIVAVLGMFNTLTISLLERTKEIGLMMTLGGRRSDMRKLFIIEATLLSVLGAIAGIIMAVFNGRIVDIIMNNFANRRGVAGQNFTLFSTPIWLMLALVGFMLLVGMLVVYIPARRAEKINPIDALRRE